MLQPLFVARPKHKERKTSYRWVPLTPRQDAILLALRDHGVLSTDLVLRLLFGPGARTSAQALLLALYRGGYVLRQHVPPEDGLTGKGTYVYALAARGRAHLAAQGRDLAPRFRPADFAQRSRYTLRHTLETNAFLIDLARLCRTDPRIRLACVRSEHELRRAPTAVALPGGRTATVVPDAWADLRIRGGDGTYRASYLVEVDRATRERRSFQAKIEKLVALVAGPYEQAYAAPAAAVTIAFVATRGEAHAARLVSWIEQELARLDQTRLAPLFVVTPYAPLHDAPAALFLAPRSARPFGRRRFPLIALDPDAA